MNNSYFDLPSRIEEDFAEIDNDIIIDLRETNEEYSELKRQLSDMKQRHPFIGDVMEGNGEIHLTAEEHAVFLQYLRLYRKADDMGSVEEEGGGADPGREGEAVVHQCPFPTDAGSDAHDDERSRLQAWRKAVQGGYPDL